MDRQGPPRPSGRSTRLPHGTDILERAENIDGLHRVIGPILALRIADGWVRDARPQLLQRDVLGTADEQALVAGQRRLGVRAGRVAPAPLVLRSASVAAGIGNGGIRPAMRGRRDLFSARNKSASRNVSQVCQRAHPVRNRGREIRHGAAVVDVYSFDGICSSLSPLIRRSSVLLPAPVMPITPMFTVSLCTRRRSVLT